MRDEVYLNKLDTRRKLTKEEDISSKDLCPLCGCETECIPVNDTVTASTVRLCQGCGFREVSTI